MIHVYMCVCVCVCVCAVVTERSVAEWSPVRLDTAAFIVPMAALICLNLVILVGNMMVIMAVFTHSKLRSMTTNKFIVSLAFADLMVGLVVLPFSSANEVPASASGMHHTHQMSLV